MTSQRSAFLIEELQSVGPKQAMGQKMSEFEVGKTYWDGTGKGHTGVWEETESEGE